MRQICEILQFSIHILLYWLFILTRYRNADEIREKLLGVRKSKIPRRINETCGISYTV